MNIYIYSVSLCANEQGNRNEREVVTEEGATKDWTTKFSVYVK